MSKVHNGVSSSRFRLPVVAHSPLSPTLTRCALFHPHNGRLSPPSHFPLSATLTWVRFPLPAHGPLSHTLPYQILSGLCLPHNYNNIQILLAMHGIELNPGPIEPERLTIAHVNVNSITVNNKLEELEQFVGANNIKILALTETKLVKTVADSQYFLKDFHPPPKRHRCGGGVALYVLKSLPFLRLSNLEIGEEEWVWAKIKTHYFTSPYLSTAST